MNKFIIFLRGINVSGKNKVIMADLRKQLEGLSFQNVVTYIQSGNIVLESDQFAEGVRNEIVKFFQSQYDYTVPTLVLTKQELDHIYQNNPFLNHKKIDIKFLHVTLLIEEPPIENWAKIEPYINENEQILKDGKCLYLYFPKGYGRAKLTNNFIETKLKIQATTRNWKTTSKMVELSSN